jgi:hypothetical protein
VTQPSKIGPLLLAFFGLPFLCFGLFGVYAFLISSPAIHKHGNPVAGACFAAVFALIGGGLILIAVAGYGGLKQQAAREEANPDTPWLWRADWASSRSQSLTRNQVFAWWIGTLLVGMIAVPVALGALPSLLPHRDPKALIVIGFLLLPLILLVGALRSTIRRIRYGRTYFEFNSLPFVPGRRLTGQIQLSAPAAPAHGMNLRLSCIRRFVTGSGEDQSKNEFILWQDERNVPEHELMVGPLGTSIPVDFAIPEDAVETNQQHASDQLVWVLHAQADVRGVDYADDFEVPVFRLSAQARPASELGTSTTQTVSNRGATLGTTSFTAAPRFFSDCSDVPPHRSRKSEFRPPLRELRNFTFRLSETRFEPYVCWRSSRSGPG